LAHPGGSAIYFTFKTYQKNMAKKDKENAELREQLGNMQDTLAQILQHLKK
jgi:hypothetical protein